MNDETTIELCEVCGQRPIVNLPSGNVGFCSQECERAYEASVYTTTTEYRERCIAQQEKDSDLLWLADSGEYVEFHHTATFEEREAFNVLLDDIVIDL